MISYYVNSAFYDLQICGEDISESWCPSFGTGCAPDQSLPVIRWEMTLMIIYPSLGLPNGNLDLRSVSLLSNLNSGRDWDNCVYLSHYFTRLMGGTSRLHRWKGRRLMGAFRMGSLRKGMSEKGWAYGWGWELDIRWRRGESESHERSFHIWCPLNT